MIGESSLQAPMARSLGPLPRRAFAVCRMSPRLYDAAWKSPVAYPLVLARRSMAPRPCQSAVNGLGNPVTQAWMALEPDTTETADSPVPSTASASRPSTIRTKDAPACPHPPL